MNARLLASMASATTLLALTAQAQDGAVMIGSVWNGPVSTYLCAPVTSCAALRPDLAPLLQHPTLLADPSLLQDVLLLLEYPEVVADPATLGGLLAAQPDLLANPDTVRALLEASPTLLQDIQAMPEPITLVLDGTTDPLALPPGLAELFEGLVDVSSESADVTIFSDADGSTILMGGNLGAGGAADGAADAVVVIDMASSGNRAEDHDVTRRSLIRDSFQGNLGMVGANQSSGNLNNQANVRAVAIGRGRASVPLVDVAVAAQQRDSLAISQGGVRENRIENSFLGGAGVVGVNQSAGNLNQQANVLALAIGIGLAPGVAALGDADLGSLSADNLVQPDPNAERAEVVRGSFGDFRGIAQVSQSSGDGNLTRNTLSFSLEVLP